MSNTKHQRSRLVVLILSVVIPGSALAADRDGTSDVRGLVDAGQYREALKQISQHLGANTARDTPASPDRYELLCLKGESLLHLDDRRLAGAAFEQAARAAPDPRMAATPRAMALLIKKSAGNRYKPKGGSATGIDIVAPDSRREALAAMLADMSSSLKPTIEQALRGKSLPPMMEVLPSVFDLAAVEYASTGTADQSRTILTEFGGHARELMETELRRVRLRIDGLDEAANSLALTSDQLGRRGLHTNERNELRDLAAYAQQIADSARKVRADVRQLGLEPSERWEAIVAEAVDGAEMARAVLDQTP
jgi:hypothetical protein